MQEQKKYHQRKLAIIEMIEECEKMIKREHRFLISLPSGFIDAVKNSTKTIQRYERIKQRLMKWLGELNTYTNYKNYTSPLPEKN